MRSWRWSCSRTWWLSCCNRCVRLGVATGRDLAQMCRDYFSPRVNCLWVLMAVCGMWPSRTPRQYDRLQLLFGIPLVWVYPPHWTCLCCYFLQSKGFRYVEAWFLVATVGICFRRNSFLPTWSEGNFACIYLIRDFTEPRNAVHRHRNLENRWCRTTIYSSIVQTRWQPTPEKRWTIKFAPLIRLWLSLALFPAILIVAAATFHPSGYQNVAEIQDAWLLSPLWGKCRQRHFGLALPSGQSSTLTATLAGQIVMEGF